MRYPLDCLSESSSDKTDSYHKYGNFYDMAITLLFLLNDNKPISVCELGVSKYGRGSGHAFCEMPYVERFVGVDKNATEIPFNDKGVFLQGDAYHFEMLRRVEKHAPFHLIIDDCSHRQVDWICFIDGYAQFCATPSFFVIEDCHSPAKIPNDFLIIRDNGANMNANIAARLKLR